MRRWIRQTTWVIGALGWGLGAAGPASGELRAERMTPASVERLRVGGPDAIAGVGDWALGNGVLCAAVSDPAHESVLLDGGGTLVDLGHCGRGDDQFHVLQPLFNLSRGNTPPVSEIAAERDGDEARIVTRGATGGLAFETSYVLDRARPRVLQVVTRIRREAEGERLFLFGDVVLHGRASLAAFTAHTLQPELSVGFAHPRVDSDRIVSMFRGIRTADLQVLVGEGNAHPGIAYGLWLRRARFSAGAGAARDLDPLAVNGRSFSLLGVLAHPLWLGSGGRLGLLELAQIPLMDLAPGDEIRIEREIHVADRADVASITDRVHAGAPRVSGRVDDPEARLEISTTRGEPVTWVRPGPEGRFSFRAPPGAYALRARTPDGRAALRGFGVNNGDVALAPIGLGAPARVALPRMGPVRLVFVGLEGTPDPRFGDDGTGLRFAHPGAPGRDAGRIPSSLESADVCLLGNGTDPDRVSLRPGRYRVLATRGPEYAVTEVEIEARAGETVALAIAPPPRALETPGWIAADLHVHADPSDDSALPLRRQAAAFAAQGGELLVSTDHDRVTDYGPVLRELGLAGEIASSVGVELTSTVRSAANPHTSGHWNAFPVARDELAYRDGAPAHEGLRARQIAARLVQADASTLLQLNHPRGGGDLAFFRHLSVAGEPFDPTRPLTAAPNHHLVETDPETGLRDLDFQAVELMNGPSMERFRAVRADWLSLLLQGEFRTGTANSDSHVARDPVALPRNYLRVPVDDPGRLAPADWIEAVRTGRVCGTTGPLLEVALEGAGPGDRFTGRRGELRVAVRAAPWVPVERLRVYMDGALVEETPVQAGSDLTLPLAFEADAFVTAEVEGTANATYAALASQHTPFAFCNPIFVDADGDGAWTPPGLPARLPAAISDPHSGS